MVLQSVVLQKCHLISLLYNGCCVEDELLGVFRTLGWRCSRSHADEKSSSSTNTQAHVQASCHEEQEGLLLVSLLLPVSCLSRLGL